MSYNVINPYQTFRDSTGAVRAGGFITFYDNKTTDLAAIFSDEARNVPQTNPYELDAHGRITGDVKYSGLLTLKIQNSDLSDTRTDDNVATLVVSLETSSNLSDLDDTFISAGNLQSGYVVADKAEAAGLTLTSADAGRKIFITSDDGGEFTIEFNATPGTYSDNGGAYTGTVFIPSGGDGAIGIVRDYDGDIFLPWFGVPEDNTNISTEFNITMVAALAEGKNVSGTSGATYGIGAQLLMKCGVFVTMTGATITRLAAYTTAEPAITNTSDNTKDLTVIGGTWNDDTSVTQPFMSFSGVRKLEVFGGRYESMHDISIKARSTLETNIYANKFKDNVNNTSVEIDNNSNTSVTLNNFNNVLVCAKMEASQAVAGRAIFSNNIVNVTGDTAVFMRALSGNTRSQMIANDNTFTDVGKAAVKFSVPVGNANSVIYGGIANGNTVKGYGMNFSSPAISAFRSASDPTVTIDSFIAVGNVITGLDSTDTISTIVSDAAAISARFVDKVVLNNITHDLVEEGVQIFESSNISIYGVVKNACQSAGDGGISIEASEKGTIDASVDGTGSSKSGLLLNKAKYFDIKGSYLNSANYGIEHSGSGGDPDWSNFNRISAVLTGNSTGPILWAGGKDGQETGCIDDSGSRHSGDATRRGLLALRANGNIGFEFLNETTGLPNWWDGSVWKDATGATV